MSDYPYLDLEIRGHVALITINNPPANTWNPESLAGLTQLVADLNANRDIYSLVVTGQGEKFFSAGADLKEFAEGDKNPTHTMIRRFGEAFEALADFRGVSIAAVNGYAMGGGLECALACDIRIAEEHAVMALPEAKVGLLPGAGGTQRLPRLVGEPWAKRVILCGEQIKADTALRIGLAEEVVAKGAGLERALELAAQVENQSPISVAVCKKLINGARSRPLVENLPREREEFINLCDTEDQREGVQAFFEKRKPTWKNR